MAPLYCDHCQLKSITPTLAQRLYEEAPYWVLKQGWGCPICGCWWTLEWELVKKGKHCPVHGLDSVEWGGG